MIEYNEMVKVVAKSGRDIINDLTPESVYNLHMAIGICGEVGELLEALRDGEDNILEELGDIEFYFEGLKQGIQFEIDDDQTNILFNDWNLRPLMEALSIEAGNILDAVKKQAVYAKDLNIGELIVLMMDFRAILTALYNHSEINSSPYMAKCANVEKLSKRYEGFEYTNEAARKRADKTE